LFVVNSDDNDFEVNAARASRSRRDAIDAARTTMEARFASVPTLKTTRRGLRTPSRRSPV
jgi:hypothetical protein